MDDAVPGRGIQGLNIQKAKSMAKVYQVKQVLLAIDKLEAEHGLKE